MPFDVGGDEIPFDVGGEFDDTVAVPLDAGGVERDELGCAEEGSEEGSDEYGNRELPSPEELFFPCVPFRASAKSIAARFRAARSIAPLVVIADVEGAAWLERVDSVEEARYTMIDEKEGSLLLRRTFCPKLREEMVKIMDDTTRQNIQSYQNNKSRIIATDAKCSINLKIGCDM